jgi:formylmethanofuran dehydrogenase subunit E
MAKIDCAHCGDEAYKPNMMRNCNGDLLCSECIKDPEAVPDDAPEMPDVEDIL